MESARMKMFVETVGAVGWAACASNNANRRDVYVGGTDTWVKTGILRVRRVFLFV